MSVYFIQAGDDGPIKIGTSTDVEARLETLQRTSPTSLRLLAFFPGERRHEEALHERLAEDRMHGEWFRPSPAVFLAARDGPPEVAPKPPPPAATRRVYHDHGCRGSIELYVWAWAQDVTPEEKLVLLAMSDSPNGPAPTPDRLGKTGISEGRLAELLSCLRESGHIRPDGLLRGQA